MQSGSWGRSACALMACAWAVWERSARVPLVGCPHPFALLFAICGMHSCLCAMLQGLMLWRRRHPDVS